MPYTDTALEEATRTLFGDQRAALASDYLQRIAAGTCDLFGAAAVFCAANFPAGTPHDLPLTFVQIVAGDRCANVVAPDVPNHRLLSRWIAPQLAFTVAATMHSCLDLSCLAVDAPEDVAWEVVESRGMFGALVRYDFPGAVHALAHYGEPVAHGAISSSQTTRAAVEAFACLVHALSAEAAFAVSEFCEGRGGPDGDMVIH